MKAASASSANEAFTRWQLGIAMLFALGFVGAFAHEVLRSPNVPFLLEGDAPWIVAQTPIQTNGMVIDPAHPPLAFFERHFSGDAHAERVVLRVRALRDVTLFLNRQPLLATDPQRWKTVTELDVTSRIVPGDNVIFARVRNLDGNPALQLRIDGLAEPLLTDTQWPSAWEGDPVDHAAFADDSIRHPESTELPAPFPALRAKALPLAVFSVLGAALFLLAQSRPGIVAWAPTAALGLVMLFWILLLRRVVQVPVGVGFDGEAHVAYIEWLFAHRGLPLPSDGAAMYHPPLAHAFSALLLGALGPFGLDARVILALPPLSAGFGMVWIARAMARALVPGAVGIETVAILLTGFLPMNLTIASCVSNEGPFAFFASLALLAALHALLRARANLRDDVLLGVLLGAAALIKYSVLLWIPLLLGFLGLKRLVVERAGVGRAISGFVLGLALVIALAGWVYVRNWLLTGDPIVTSRTLPGVAWWQLPGFHTAAFFTHFGESLAAPWFSGFSSFWDSLYTTFWGDGLLSGAVSPRSAVRRWNYTWMASVFVLALPATLVLGVGWIETARKSLCGSDHARRIAFSLLFVLPPVLFAPLLSANLRYPYWSLAKSFYALALTPSVGVIGALGFMRLDALLKRAAARSLLYAWATAFLAAIACSYVA